MSLPSPLPVKILRDGTTLPVLGLGTWLMGGDNKRIESAQDDADVHALRAAVEMGYRHIDTAEIYGDGHAEEILGRAIRSLVRHDLFIATKAAQGHHDKQSLKHALERSLRRLGTDYIDLYYLHRPTPETPLEETAEALDVAQRTGQIRHVGVCNFSKERLDKLQSLLSAKIVANQVHYNLAFREPEAAGLFEHAQQKDYFVVAWRPVRLVRRTEPVLIRHNVWEKGAFPVVDEMAEKYGKTNTQVALAWTMRHEKSCALIKSSSPAHLSEALGSFFEMTAADVARLSKEFLPHYNVSDTIPLS